jgi:arylsulfatase A-like enzyme
VVDHPVSRRSFVRTAAVGSAALALSPKIFAQPAKLPRKSNLLVFLPDQFRADTLGCYGGKNLHAPNLEKLASQSVLFEHAYVTQPVCSPSRSSLLTGTWPHQNGCKSNKDSLSPQLHCLPEMLTDPDYRTGYFGKWHLGDELSAQHGFQEWATIEEYAKSASGKKVTGFTEYSKFLISKGYKPKPHKGHQFSHKFVAALPFEVSRPKFLEIKTCEFLERHRNDPFVIFVAFFEPHPPYQGPFDNEHAHEEIALDPTVADVLGEDIPLRTRLIRESQARTAAAAGGFRILKQKYLGLITEIDHCIGTILAKLEDLGLSDRTITALTSDHGDMIGAHGLLGKKLMYEQSARVPYLVRVPGQRPLRCSQSVSHIDFVPTMLDLMAKPLHPQCVGRSHTDLIRGENSAPLPVFLEWAPSPPKKSIQNSKLASPPEIVRALSESTRAIVSPDGWKLCLRDKDKNELYNMRDDPDERHNLYYAGAHGEIVTKLTDEIHHWQERAGDNLKVPG